MDMSKYRNAFSRNRQKIRKLIGSTNSSGELLAANNQEISGWAFDPKSEEPLLVTIEINGIEAVKVWANLNSKVFKSVDGQDCPCGFRFAVHETLRKKLPLRSTVDAKLPDGTMLAQGKQFACALLGVDGVSAQELGNAFASGSILIPKSGLLMRPIGARSGWASKALKSYQEAKNFLGLHLGKDLFIAYGTLLGLVRENKLLGHDDDVDAMFMLDSTNAKAAGEEFARIAQKLSAAGANIGNVYPGGNFHWRMSNGIVLDVFGCWADKETLNGYMFSFQGAKSDIFPTSTRELHGLEVTTPAAPERFLEGIYGAKWRVSDPQFQWRPRQEILNRMAEFGKGVRGE